jgi:hypothetical protein
MAATPKPDAPAPTLTPRSRVKELRHVRAGDLVENPKNWRRHPQFQVQALRGALAKVGYADALIAREVDGQLLLLDGHLRAATTPDAEVPVLIVDLDDEEADFVLATLDPLGAMAKTDGDMLKALTDAIENENADLARMFTKALTAAGVAVRQGTPPSIIYTDDQVIDAAFDWFRKTGFPYRHQPLHVCMQELNELAQMGIDQLAHTSTGYQVADTYHTHRYTARTGHAKPTLDVFNDDRLLRKALRVSLDVGDGIPDHYFTALSLTGTAPPTNFRPGFAAMFYRGYCQPDSVVLDTSTGYGGRLVGFMAACPRGRYIGIDPSTATHAANLRMAADLGYSDRVELYCEAAEDMYPHVLAGRADFAFTSPPYFARERYCDEPTQSDVRYTTADTWRAGFLEPMLRLQYAALKPGRYAVLNVMDYKHGPEKVPMIDWTMQAAVKAGFAYVRTEEFQLHYRFGRGAQEIGTEPVLVFQKPSDA